MITEHFTVIPYDLCKQISEDYGENIYIKLCGCWNEIHSVQVYADKEHTDLLDTFCLMPSGYCDVKYNKKKPVDCYGLKDIPENATITSAHLNLLSGKKDVTRQIIRKHRAIHHKNFFQKQIYGVTRGRLIISFLGALVFLAFFWLFACGLKAMMGC